MLAGLGGGINVTSKVASDTYTKIDIGRDIKKDGKVADVINEGLSRDEKSKAFKSAQKLDNAKKPTSYALGAQTIKNEREIIKENEFLDALEEATGVRQDIVKTLPNDVNGRFVSGGKISNESAQSNRDRMDVENKYAIRKIFGTDKVYVKADRQVVKGNTPTEWGASIEKYINETIRKGKDVNLISDDGDILTITADTSGKAKFRNTVKRSDGTKDLMTDDEYLTKLNAEGHLDELAQVSHRGKKDVPDYKNHGFAKDGFNYRTAYFEDFDGKYYKLTISVGKNGNIKTVYNIGKIEEASLPLVAQRPGAESAEEHKASNDSISKNNKNVNTKNSVKDEDGQNKDSERRKFIPRGRVEISEGATSIPRTIKHENTHAFKENAPEAYKVYEDRVIEIAKASSPDAYNRAIEKIAAKYRAKNEVPTQELLREEIAAELTNEFLPKGAEDVKRIAETNPQEVWKLISAIRNAKATIKDLTGKTYQDSRTGIELTYKQLNELENLYNQALYVAADNYRNGVESQGDGETKYSTKSIKGKKYDYSKSFAEQLDDWDKGLIPKQDSLIVGRTSAVLRKVGFSALPVTINQKHIDYAINGTKDIDHHITKGILIQLPRALENPVAVIRSHSNPDRVVAILSLRNPQNGKQIVAPFEIDGYGRQNNISIDSNAITSILGKTNALRQLQKAVNTDSNTNMQLFYWNKKEALSLLQKAGHQLPGVLPQDGLIHSIRDKGSNVKWRFNDVTETQQFKRWFDKSKVINEDGTPKVVYHGTADEFYIFDKAKNGTNTGAQSAKKAFFFTDSKKVADGYANDARPESINQLYRRAEMLDNQSAWNGKYKEAEQAWQEYEDAELGYDGTNYTMGVYLSIKNPLIYDFKGSEYRETTYNDLIKQAIKENRDGVIFLNTFDSSNNAYDEMCNVYAVFEPTQIKSATDNIGTFDKENPDIRYSFKDEDGQNKASARGVSRQIIKEYNSRAELGEVNSKSSIIAYSEEESAKISKEGKTYRNLVVDKDISLYDFFNNRSRRNTKNIFEKLYLGKISEETANRINEIFKENEIDIDVTGEHFIVTNDLFGHTKKRHGENSNESAEKVTAETLEDFMDTIKNPDDIIFDGFNHDGTPAVIFKKNISGTEAHYVQFNSINRNGLIGKTFYFKGKKRGDTSAHDGNSSALYVQNDQSQSPNNNIQQSEEIVKAISKEHTFLPQEEVTEARLKEEYGVEDIADAFPDPVTREESRRIRSLYSKENRINTLGSAFYTAVVDSYNPIHNFVKTAERIYFDKYYEGDIKNSEKHFRGKDNPYVLATNSRDAASRASYIVTNKLEEAL